MKYKNKTKRYKGGGENDIRLDDNFIINNLSEILNERPIKYIFGVKKEEHYGIVNFLVYIKNIDEEIEKYNLDDDPCVAFRIINLKEGLSILINSINKCAPISNYGNFILNSFKEFAIKFDYYSVVITSDGSVLQFYLDDDGIEKYLEIDLSYLSILSSGESWYNRMGFYTPVNVEQIQDNLYKIRQDIQDIDDSGKIINLIDEEIKKYKGRDNRIPECYKLINSYGKFRELYNFILNLTKKTDTNSIQEVFQEIVQIIKTKCNTIERTCSLNYDTIMKINCFIKFVYLLLDIKYKATGLVYKVKSRSSGGKRNKTLKNKTKKNKRKNKNNYKLSSK